MGRRANVLLLCLAAAATGCVQRAILLPIAKPMLENLANVSRPSRFTAVMGDAAKEEGAAIEDAARFAIHPDDSTLRVRGGDLLTGMHDMRFGRWRGAFFVPRSAPPDRPSGRLVLEIGLDSLDTDAIVDDSLRNHLMEVSKYPKAIFAGAILPRADGEEGYVFQGRLSLHGVEKAIRFYVDVRRESGGYRLGSEFAMSRDAFGMHRKDTLDLVIFDDFRVVVDLLAHPENVSAEALPAK